MRLRSSLRYIITRNYIFLAVLPVLLFGATTLFLLSRNLTQEITGKNYFLATSVAGEVETFLREPLSLINQVKAIVSSPGILSSDGMSGYLNSVVDNYPFFEMVQLLDERGTVTYVAPYTDEYIGTDMSRQAFYETTLTNKKPTWSSTFISMRSGSPTLSLSVTIQNGMIVGYLNLATLKKIVEKVSDPHKYAVITDKEGTIIADHSLLRVQHRENLVAFHQIRSNPKGEHDAFTISDRHKKVIASAVIVPLTGWHVFFLQHYDDAFAPLNDTRVILFLGIVFTLVVALLAAIAGARSTSKPFVQLLQNVTRVSKGDYTLSTKLKGFCEIEELDRNFRSMAAAIRQREVNILESEQVHRELIEALPHGLQENDINGLITFTNTAYDQIFECDPGQAIGKPIWETETTPGRKLKLEKYLQYLVKEQPAPAHYEAQAITYSGNLIDIQVDWQYKRDQVGKLVGFISVITDTTEKKQLESNLRQAQKMEAIGTLSGGIAHDFNNILAVILGYSQMILQDLPDDSKNREYQEQVIKASLRARDLVQHLLIFSRKQDHKKGPVEINKVVTEATNFLRATIPTTINFKLDISDNTGTIEADATQIHQVILNLCTNAAHAMEDSGGELIVCLEPVIFDAYDSRRPAELSPGKYAVLTVKDNGAGIDSENISRIFDPFFTTKETGKGTGLGLAVVHGIVSSHSGTISVKSREGGGTTFAVYFPVIENYTIKIAEEAVIPRGNGEHILIVDDETDINSVTSLMLEDMGYSTTTSTDPYEALAFFRENPREFDLLITDQTMPGLTGIELSREISSLRPDVPILLCTGYSSTLTLEQMREVNIAHTLMKPLDREALLNTIASLLK